METISNMMDIVIAAVILGAIIAFVIYIEYVLFKFIKDIEEMK